MTSIEPKISTTIHKFVESTVEMSRLALRTNPLSFFLIILFNMAQGIEPVISAYLLKQTIDAIIEHQAHYNSDLKRLILLALIQFLVTLTYRWSDSYRNYLTYKLNKELSLLTQNLLYEKLNTFQGIKYFEQSEFYNTVQLGLAGAQSGPSQVIGIFTSFIRSFMVLISFIGVLISLQGSIAIVVILTSIPHVWARMRISKQRFEAAYESTFEERRLGYIQRILSSSDFARELRFFNLGQYFLDAFHLSFRHIFDIAKQQQFRELKIDLGVILISSFVTLLSMIYVLSETALSRISLGDFTFIIGALTSVQISLHGLAFTAANLNENVLFFNQFKKLLSFPSPLSTMHKQDTIPTELKHGIEFRNVSFRYSPSQDWILRECSFTIPKGKCLGIVGVNGSGKSTIVKLLLRFYDPDEGQILWDNIDIRNFDPVELRNNISGILQDFVRYDLSVNDNIGLGNLNEIDNSAYIKQVSVKAGSDEFIARLPNSYDTFLSLWLSPDESNTDISGGQWQKIAIARMLMRNAQFYILDEPTSALDVRSEHDVYTHFSNIVIDKTSLLISHRFTTISIADKIVVLDKGKIIEYGSHIELMELNGEYRKLYILQSNQYTASK